MKLVEIASIELGYFLTDTRLYSILLLNHLGINCQPVKCKTHQDASRKSNEDLPTKFSILIEYRQNLLSAESDQGRSILVVRAA